MLPIKRSDVIKRSDIVLRKAMEITYFMCIGTYLANVPVESVYFHVADPLRRRRTVEVSAVFAGRPATVVRNCKQSVHEY
jgi:hypothetical protein